MLLAACNLLVADNCCVLLPCSGCQENGEHDFGKTKYTALSLSCEECEEDVCTYLDHVGDEGSLRRLPLTFEVPGCKWCGGSTGRFHPEWPCDRSTFDRSQSDCNSASRRCLPGARLNPGLVAGFL